MRRVYGSRSRRRARAALSDSDLLRTQLGGERAPERKCLLGRQARGSKMPF